MTLTVRAQTDCEMLSFRSQLAAVGRAKQACDRDRWVVAMPGKAKFFLGKDEGG
jgi:hypothetical protein